MKKSARLHEPTTSGNSILLPATIGSFPTSAFAGAPYLIEFLDQFGGLTLDIPPGGFCGCVPHKMMPLRREAFPGLGDWFPSYAMFYPGNGDVIIAREDGAAGLWQHELAPDDQVGDEVHQPSAAMRQMIAATLSGVVSDAPRMPKPSCCVEDLRCDVISAINQEVSHL